MWLIWSEANRWVLPPLNFLTKTKDSTSRPLGTHRLCQ